MPLHGLPGQQRRELNSNPTQGREPETKNQYSGCILSPPSQTVRSKGPETVASRLLTGVGELEALVGVRAVGVELQPQVVRGAVEDQAHQLVPREGPQWPRGTVPPVVDLVGSHSVRPCHSTALSTSQL